MKTILVPVDFSEEAKSAFWYALEMALVSKAEIILLHAFYHPFYSLFTYPEEVSKTRLERQKLQKINGFTKKALDSFCKYFSLTSGSAVNARAQKEETADGAFSVYIDEEKVVSVTAVCRFGLTEDAILGASSEHGADLIVMGMRGAGAISHAISGSTTVRVIEESQVPVLLVPLQVRFEGLSSVVLAINPDNLPGEATLSPVGALAAIFNSRLAILQLYRSYRDKEENKFSLSACGALKAGLPQIDYKLYASQGEDVAAGIERFLEAKQADLLVLVPQKHSFLSRLRNRSITGKMAAKASVPLLALPLMKTTAPALRQELAAV